MIRTFQSRVNKITLLCCLLPATVLAVYFFWIQLPLPAFFFMLAMVFIVERLIHTTYTFTDDGCLHISKGRFSRRVTIDLHEVEKLEVCRTGWFGKCAVVIYRREKHAVVVNPMVTAEFCHVLMKRKSQVDE
ncbi:MAG: hypothetical protein NC388_04445 [Clostridium sp.]|nr:hypothetical protein [Clostridium sp.]